MLLRHRIAPCRAEGLQYQPCLRELTSLDPVGLHACPTARLAGFGISPLERKTKPRAVALERVIIDNDANIRSFLSDLGNLCRLVIPCHCPVAAFIMPDVVFRDAARHQVELAFMPNAFPSVEQVAHRSLV
jgi:hypothetical protein